MNEDFSSYQKCLNVFSFKLHDLLKQLKPDELFVIKYFDIKTNNNIYVLNVRTLERVWNMQNEHFEYYDTIPNTDNLENYYQNCFGLYSNKSFESLDDPELTMFLTLSYGQTFIEMNIPILEKNDYFVSIK
jgi:hypothetical protein